MPPVTLNINIPIGSVSMVENIEAIKERANVKVSSQELDKEKQSLAQTGQALKSAIAKFGDLHSEIFASHAEHIAKLSVSIARKILQHQIESDQYEISNIITKALNAAPSQKDVVVRLNPEDLQRYKDADGQDTMGNVSFIADATVRLAECRVETDRGTVNYFIEEHLMQISEALTGKED